MSGRVSSESTSAGAPAAPAGEGGGTPRPPVAGASPLGRAMPSFALILIADLVALWAAVSGSWAVLVVVDLCIIDGFADGLFAWVRARASWRAGAAEDERDQVLVKEFLRTYLVVMVAMILIAYMVFSGKLLKPGGLAPHAPGAGFLTWQFWVAVGALVAMRAFVYFWDFVRGGEARFVPPAAAVAEPLRRLFVLQFGVLIAGLLVYWLFDSSVAGLAIILVAKTAADLVLAVLERLRVARIKAAVEAGIKAERRPPEKAQARRGGRRRRKR